MKNRLVRLQTMNNKETIKDNTLRKRSIREAIKPSPECAYIKDNCQGQGTSQAIILLL